MFQQILQIITLLVTLTSVAQAAPVQSDEAKAVAQLEKRASTWWLANIQRDGQVAYGGTAGYQIYRNVMSFGAKGDGTTDDTQAINNAISSGGRCGLGCNSTTTTPAIVYFPPGKYLVSKPIVQYYYTQLIGDAVTPPTITASSGFVGIAVIDSDPYENGGANWYTNQNNFFRQVRNFVIDLTQMPMSQGAGIHWQVAQATSLQNIIFNMVKGGGQANKQQGIFMDNGSGGWMSDLTFNGGGYGAFFGNQQFTTRNLVFNGCQTAIYMNWNWLWSLKSLNIQNCAIGIDMSNNPSNQTVGSVILQDSKITNTPIGIKTAYSKSGNVPVGGGALIIDNVDFTGSATAVQGTSGSVLAGGSVVKSWGQGRQYHGTSGSSAQQALTAPSKPSALLGSSGNIAERSKPQYVNTPASSFVDVKSKGAKGDGTTDDTQAIQNAMNTLPAGSILYFPHGAYIISSTVNVPSNIKIVGEIWSLIMAKGQAFQNQDSPQPVWRIGQVGSTGNVEIQDLIFETVGPQPGAIMMEWNVAGTAPGQAGMWDVHFRIGGSTGTNLEEAQCKSNPSVTAAANPACLGAFLLFHATPQSSAYVENSWLWVADHELDGRSHGAINDANQLNIYNGRGVLIESQKATWLYGTSAEHSILYNYAIGNAKNVYMSAIQTETPYMQSNPDATTPFTAQPAYYDPNFAVCTAGDERCKKSWGLRVTNSQDVLIYGAGLYSFFDNYSQDCNALGNCQTNMVSIQNSQRVSLYGLSTFSAINMVTADFVSQMKGENNKSNFCSTIAVWTQT